MDQKSLYIITGSSKGIGEALVKLLLENPQHLVVGVSRSDVSHQHSNYQHISCDFNDVKALEKSVEEIFPPGNFDKIILVNNAGWIGQIAHFGKLKPASIKQIFQVNTVAPAILMNAFVKKYAAQKSAERLVINISSGAAGKPIDGWSGYSASKSALNMLTLVAQEEAKLNETGIRFFALSPGVVDTGMQTDIRQADKSDFSSLEKFLKLKSEGNLSPANSTAEKIIYLMTHADSFGDVLLDVRGFV